MKPLSWYARKLRKEAFRKRYGLIRTNRLMIEGFVNLVQLGELFNFPPEEQRANAMAFVRYMKNLIRRL